MFGLIVDGGLPLRVNLLNGAERLEARKAVFSACRLATEKFREQMEKIGASTELFSAAVLEISKGNPTSGFVNGRSSPGHDVVLTTEVLTDRGERYRVQKTMFVAAHNPNIEQRSNRMPNQSTDPTLSSGTSRAGHESRLP